MKRILILSLFYMGLVATLASAVVTALIYHGILRNEVKENLKSESVLLQQSYSKISTYDELEEFASEALRITLINREGKVLFESAVDKDGMENHLARPEIKMAIENGAGSDTRISSTIGIEDYYYATLLDDGNVLRLSVKANSIYSGLGRSLYLLIALIGAIVILSVILSIWLTQKILSPIKKISSSLDVLEKIDDLEGYPELMPMIKEIQYQRSIQEQMRQEFTANVSHELKTPLTAISGYAEMIETGIAREEDIKNFAGKIKKEATRLLALIGDILKLSKLDLEMETQMNEQIDLLEIAKECKEHLEYPAKQRGIQISVFGTADLFLGNRVEIYELIYNLVDNAIKYNRDNGNVDIYLDKKTIKVCDTGIGISEENRQRVFERFYRVDKSRSRETGGTGLGLSIVKHIAQRHNATILVDSTLHVGTEITVDFAQSKED